MGLMKEYLAEKITEFAKMINKTEQEVYEDENLYNAGVHFAQKCLDAKQEYIRQKLQESD